MSATPEPTGQRRTMSAPLMLLALLSLVAVYFALNRGSHPEISFHAETDILQTNIRYPALHNVLANITDKALQQEQRLSTLSAQMSDVLNALTLPNNPLIRNVPRALPTSTAQTLTNLSSLTFASSNISEMRCQKSFVNLPRAAIPSKEGWDVWKDKFYSSYMELSSSRFVTSPADYESLSVALQGPPFGLRRIPKESFMGAQRKTMPGQPFLKDLCSKTCAVVGSSGNMIGRNKGKKIDAHDVIYRVNHAVTDGYESDVGSRTTFRVVYKESWNTYMQHTMWRCRQHRAPACRDPTPEEHFLFTMYSPEGWSFFANNMSVNDKRLLRNYPQDETAEGHFHIMSPAVAHYVDTVLMDSRGSRHGKGWPSAGLLTLIHAIYSCKSVTMYGFSPDAKCSHYWTDCGKGRVKEEMIAAGYNISKPGAHDFNHEQRIIRSVLLSSPSARLALG